MSTNVDTFVTHLDFKLDLHSNVYKWTSNLRSSMDTSKDEVFVVSPPHYRCLIHKAKPKPYTNYCIKASIV